MKGIYIPKYDITLQFVNKSGSLVMLNTIIQFCKYNNIEYRFATKLDNKKVYIFTRKPIDRFITSYNWFMDSSDDNYSTNKIKSKYNINNITDFIAHYETIMYEIKDTHYQPQLFELLNYNDRKFNINNIKDITTKLNLRYKSYIFLKIENIGDIISEFANTYHYMHGEQSFIEHDYSDMLILNKIDEFKTLSYDAKIHFNLLYLAMKKILDLKHHKIDNRLILIDKVANVKFDIFDIENVLYGYSLPKQLI
jgi:hypothetical protein